MNGHDIIDAASIGIGTTVSGSWTTSNWTKSIVFASQGTALLWNKGGSGVARGVGVSSDGVLYITRSTANDNSAAAVYDMYMLTNGSLVIPANEQNAGGKIVLGSGDWGNTYGPWLNIGYNTYASNPRAGWIRLTRRDGVGGDIWVDASGNLRIGAGSTSASDTGGTVVGTQTSSLDSKIILGPSATPDAAIEHVLQAARTALHQFRYKSGAFNDEVFQGIITDYAPRYGMDRDAAHPAGKSLNVIQLFNDLILSVEYLHNKLESFNGHY